MKKFFLPLFLLSVIVESTIFPYPLTLFSIILASYFVEGEILLYAFFIGVMLDIWMMRRWGLSSLFFIATLSILEIYKRKMSDYGNVLLQVIFALPFVAIYTYFFYDYFNFWFMAIFVVLDLTALYMLKKFLPIKKKKQLSV